MSPALRRMTEGRATGRLSAWRFLCAATVAALQLDWSPPAQASPVVPEQGPNLVTVLGYDRTDASGPPVTRALGMVAESEGFILTAYRAVVDPARRGRILPRLEVQLWASPGERPRKAKLVGVEPTLGLAIVKVQDAPALRPSPILGEVAIAEGSAVYAPTQPDPAAPAVTLGRLTGLNSKECYQESLTATMFRAEMVLPPSAAGAPIYTDDGRVVALWTGYVPEDEIDKPGMQEESHILPIFLAFNIYESIKQKSSLASPWTGFSVRSLTKAEQSRFPSPTGYRGAIALEYIWPKSPAQKMGFQVDDLLVQLGHNRIESPADFQKWLYMYGVGHKVKLTILRGDELLTSTYVIEERPDWAVPR